MGVQNSGPARGWASAVRQDFLASLVVFLVALPLCMGIALASGAPVATGLATGIIGGLIVGLFSGSPLQVSGPAAGLTVICGEVIREHGLPALGVVVMIAGGIQIVAGLRKLGQWFRAVSPAVIHGMLSGIGVLIVSSQIHVLVDDRPRASGLENLVSIPEAVRKGLPLPTWEAAPLRQARTQLLVLFGGLHEKQREIEAHMSRLVLRHADEEQEAAEAGDLSALAPRQEALGEDLEAARKVIVAGPLAQANGARAAQLLAALAQVAAAQDAALADLEAGNVKQAPASQRQAKLALAAVLSNLKSHDWAAKIGLLSIAVIIVWQGLAPRGLRLIPGPLLAITITTALAWWLSLPVLYVEAPDNLLEGLTFPSLNVLDDVPLRELLVAGLMMAVIGSAETLLCASAVDRMHHGPRTQYDRELTAQGIGNLLCGLVGALPMTGVIVRSAANIQAGAQSRLAAILHGVWLLIFVVALGFILRMIPTAALAGILVYTGFKLIDFKGFANLCAYNRDEAAIMLVTVIVIVVQDLLVGVATGIVLSAVKLLVTFSHLDVQLVPADGADGHKMVTLRLSGAATFLRLPMLAATLDEVPRGAHLHVDLERLAYLDHACLELLMSWTTLHESSGGQLIVDWVQLHARFRSKRLDHRESHNPGGVPPSLLLRAATQETNAVPSP